MVTDRCPLRFRTESPCSGTLDFRNFPPRYVCKACGRIFDPETVQRFAAAKAVR